MAKLDRIETYAPIAIFAFNRPNYLEACLTSLTKCEEIHRTEITVFIDKELNEKDEKPRNECIKIATNFKRKMNLKIVCSETHKGLANSIINGINQIFNWSDKIIVVEDDLIVAPFFLKFCNDSLKIFADKDSVGAVCGYLPMSFDGRMEEPFFLHEFSSWGWATWKDRWKLFEHDAKKLLDKINDQGIKHYFDVDSTYPFTEMLRNQEMGKIDSWAIRWRASLLIENKLSLYPNKPLISNKGFQGKGTHSNKTSDYENNLYSGPILIKNEIEVTESIKGRDNLKKFNMNLFEESNLKTFIYKFRLTAHNLLQKIDWKI